MQAHIKRQPLMPLIMLGVLLPGIAAAQSHRAVEPLSKNVNVDTLVYDQFEKPGGYTLDDYASKWANPFGMGEMAVPENGDTRDFSTGDFSVSAVPFRTAADFSVFDHIKYFATSTEAFKIPDNGSLMFSANIEAETPGTIPGHIISGTFIQGGAPYSATVLEGQQAGATLHMIDFYTGQLFDWFVYGNKAFALTERLPSTITDSPLAAGIDKVYTQIIEEFALEPGKNNFAIRYNRVPGTDFVEFLINGSVVATVQNIGIPLDVQNQPFITYPSLGPGEDLTGLVDNLVIGHGLFSLLDAFPFQHPEAPELAVSIPVSERIFGQGVRADFDTFAVTTTTVPTVIFKDGFEPLAVSGARR